MIRDVKILKLHVYCHKQSYLYDEGLLLLYHKNETNTC